MQPSEQIKGNLGWQERVHGRDDGDPDGPDDEDVALAIDVGDASPEEEEAAKGQDVRGDDPLLSRVGDVEVPANLWENNDDCLTR